MVVTCCVNIGNMWCEFLVMWFYLFEYILLFVMQKDIRPPSGTRTHIPTVLPSHCESHSQPTEPVSRFCWWVLFRVCFIKWVNLCLCYPRPSRRPVPLLRGDTLCLQTHSLIPILCLLWPFYTLFQNSLHSFQRSDMIWTCKFRRSGDAGAGSIGRDSPNLDGSDW